MTTKYTREHEWIRIEGDIATVGITFYAQEQLGDVVFVDLPEADSACDQGAEVAVVESVKAASDIYARKMTVGFSACVSMIQVSWMIYSTKRPTSTSFKKNSKRIICEPGNDFSQSPHRVV